MNSIKLMCAAAVLAGATGAPAFAQMANDSMAKGDAMTSGSHMRMSAADRRMMTRCKGMSHDMMMRDRACMNMMKMHPDMMKSR